MENNDENKDSEVTKISNNSKGIFEHLCSQLSKLNDGSITPEEAKAHANLAKQANNLLKYELDRAKTMAAYPSEFRKIEE